MNQSTTVSGKDFCVTPGAQVTGTVAVPGDKSISHRSVILSSLAQGRSHISGFLRSEDCLATLGAFHAMGVPSEWRDDGVLVVDGVGMHGLRAPSGPLDLGNSGTGMRLLSGLLAGQAFASTMIGDDSLMQRPMQRIARPLGEAGANIQTQNGCPPVRIAPVARLRGSRHDLKLASAQVKSAILLAGLYAHGETWVREPTPSRDHTERLLPHFGCPVLRDPDGAVGVAGPAVLHAADVAVPRDFSSAAFFLVLGAITPGSDLRLPAVGLNPGRTGLLQVLRRMGADIQASGQRLVGEEPVADLRVRGTALSGVDVSAAEVPAMIDEFPAFFVAAARASGVSRVFGAEDLRVKESDRLEAMARGLRQLGIRVESRADGLDVHGGEFGAGDVDSDGDHRIAMAFAMAGAQCRGPLRIHNVANVATSFPDFVACGRQAGLNITEQDHA